MQGLARQFVASEAERLSAREARLSRLRAFRQEPKRGDQVHLYTLLLALDLPSSREPNLSWLLHYAFVLIRISLLGLLAAINVRTMSQAMTYDARSIGHRMRLTSSLADYQLLARAGVGAQHFLRRVTDFFFHSNNITKENVLSDLGFPPLTERSAAEVGRGKEPPPRDPRFGSTRAEARDSIEQLVAAEVCAPYFEQLDTIVTLLGTLMGFCAFALAFVLITVFDPQLLLSSFFTSERTCAFIGAEIQQS
jgi:hypothetical protein